MLDRVLGLTPLETRAYRTVVGLPSASHEQLAAHLGEPPDDLVGALATLEAHGLVTRGTDGSFAAAPPSIALGALLTERRNDLRTTELELGRLDALYRDAVAGRSPDDVVDVVEGADAVRQRFAQLQLGARERVEAFVRPPVSFVSGAENTAEDRAVERGVQYRAVVDRAMLHTGALTVEQVRAAQRAGEEVRFDDRVPAKVVIVDRRLAFVATASSGPGGDEAGSALLIRESALLDIVVALWEAHWARATPLVTDAGALAAPVGARLGDLDAAVLGLLLLGFTDEVIGRHLGTSLRTVQRRVQGLMVLAGVTTRLQLGWYAARSGWIPDPGDTI
ncbi:TrmB family transcriptional regulator [Luteimicrobium sp. NPDC057192]|uniref:TrmB family transcriptional regulator n=1 Tax=Luteimicrobium sp. NPDC057192 TaxID=3346042 RepID=UPI00362BD841